MGNYPSEKNLLQPFYDDSANYFPAIKFLGQINGAIFCDIGTTWNWNDYNKFLDKNSWTESADIENETIPETGWAMSYGFGPRFIFLGLPWQIDFTWEFNPYMGTIDHQKTFVRIFPQF